MITSPTYILIACCVLAVPPDSQSNRIRLLIEGPDGTIIPDATIQIDGKPVRVGKDGIAIPFKQQDVSIFPPENEPKLQAEKFSIPEDARVHLRLRSRDPNDYSHQKATKYVPCDPCGCMPNYCCPYYYCCPEPCDCILFYCAPICCFTEVDSTSPSPERSSGEVTVTSCSANIDVTVPRDAVVYINGRCTTSTGTLRHYKSVDLKEGNKYRYVIRARIVQDGKVLESTRRIILQAREKKSVVFDFHKTAHAQNAHTP